MCWAYSNPELERSRMRLREDLRDRPLVERKRTLKRILPRRDSRLLYVDHIASRGFDLFREACRLDLEGVVGKWREGPYEADGVSTS